MTKSYFVSGILLGLGLVACSGVAADDTTTTTVRDTTTTTVQETATTTGLVVMEVTFDGETCTYEGPVELTVEDVEIVNYNEGSEDFWFWFGRLDEGRTTQEVIDHIEADPTAGSPSWTRRAFYREISGGDSWEGVRVLSPGLHSVACGTVEDGYAYFGAEFTVVP
jgi:hypothetical protein